MLLPMRIEPRTSESKSNTYSPLWAILAIATLEIFKFLSCTILFFDLNDLDRTHRAWLFKKLKFSVLHANAKLVQKGECWTWNKSSWVQSSLGVTFCYWNFCFNTVKLLVPILALLPILRSLWLECCLWGCNWIQFMHWWLCPIHLIEQKPFHFEKKITFYILNRKENYKYMRIQSYQ